VIAATPECDQRHFRPAQTFSPLNVQRVSKGASLRAQTQPQSQTFLQQQLQFSDQGIDDLRKGREVAVFRIVLVRVQADFFVDRFRERAPWKIW
jgi:hypothetical protein